MNIHAVSKISFIMQIHIFNTGISDSEESLQNCTLLCGKHSEMEKSDSRIVVTDRENITVFHKPNGLVDCIVTVNGEAYVKEDNIRSNRSGIQMYSCMCALSMLHKCII